jgi:hypothetical protein
MNKLNRIASAVTLSLAAHATHAPPAAPVRQFVL